MTSEVVGVHDRGIMYVASGNLRFLCEAVGSAESVRHLLPDVPICLFATADVLRSPLRRIEVFDQVIAVDPPVGRNLSRWAQGLSTKVQSFGKTPYESTLFLDTDTRVLRPELGSAFDLLDEFEFCAVPCRPDNSRSCALYGPMFNTGVLAYRRTPRIEAVLKDWAQLHLFHMDLACAAPLGAVSYISSGLTESDHRFLLGTDQVSLARILSPDRNQHGVKVRGLDEMWNAREYSPDELDGVIVDHASRHKVRDDEVQQFLSARSLDVVWQRDPF